MSAPRRDPAARAVSAWGFLIALAFLLIMAHELYVYGGVQ